jgi:hypothetical protein
MIDREPLKRAQKAWRKRQDEAGGWLRRLVRAGSDPRRLALCGEWTHDQRSGAGKRGIPDKGSRLGFDERAKS